MPQLKIGDRVIVKVDNRPAFNGKIIGEGYAGRWWNVRKDGTRRQRGYHKSFCYPEVPAVPNGDRGDMP